METATASDGNSASSGPATFAEAFASDASSASGPPDSSQTPAAAETPSSDQGAAPAEGTDDRSPFIPRARFDEVLAERNAIKQWKEQYAWAEQVPREQLQEAVTLAQRYKGNPIEFLQELAKEVQSHPEYGPQLKSMAARTLAAARGQSQPPGPDLSQIAIDLGNGQQISLGDLKAQWIAEVEQKFAPVAKTVEDIRAEKAKAELDREIQEFTSTTFEDVKTWAGMDNVENQKELGTYLGTMKIDGSDKREVALALNAAYRKVIVPKLGSKAQSQLLDTLQQKAAASNSVNPGAAASSAPSDVRSFNDPRLKW